MVVAGAEVAPDREDLGRSLVSDGSAHADGWSGQVAAPDWRQRWTELTPAYEQTTVQ